MNRKPYLCGLKKFSQIKPSAVNDVCVGTDTDLMKVPPQEKRSFKQNDQSNIFLCLSIEIITGGSHVVR